MTLDIEAMKLAATNALPNKDFCGVELSPDDVLALIAEVERLQAQVEALEQIARLDEQIELKAEATIAHLHKQINAVKELHSVVTAYPGGFEHQVCRECHHPAQFGVAGLYPCATLDALGVE